ncbi:MAG TPA: RNA polymerase sigma factor [Bryobacteraceae bacterium]|nr:RNA polymerase sigma factor [Bryobacteraceae bacterium]
MVTEWALEADALLMAQVCRGDEPSFELLLTRHRGTVVNHLYRMVRDRAAAEDLAQDVFLRVYRSRHRYQPQAKFTTWLFRITTNVALNWRRDTRRASACLPLDAEAERRRFEPPDESLAPDQRLMVQDRAREIRCALDALPAKQLAAVLMHKYQGMNYGQIAEVLGCSLPALKSMLFRAYATLRRRLAHFDPARAA